MWRHRVGNSEYIRKKKHTKHTKHKHISSFGETTFYVGFAFLIVNIEIPVFWNVMRHGKIGLTDTVVSKEPAVSIFS